MDFLQAAGAPVVVKYGGQDLSIPKFDMDAVIELGSKIMAERLEAQTKTMNEEQRAQYVQYYPPLPPDMVEIKRYVRTPEGMRHVIRKCLLNKDATLLQKSGPPRNLTGAEIDKFLKSAPSLLGPLSWALADMEEKPLAILKPEGGDGDKTEGNFSTSSGTPASNA